MSKLEESSDATHEELIFPCNCHEDHYLRIAWDDEDPTWRLLWIEHHERPKGLNRIKIAWKALRGKDILWNELILKPEVVHKLYEWFGSKL